MQRIIHVSDAVFPLVFSFFNHFSSVLMSIQRIYHKIQVAYKVKSSAMVLNSLNKRTVAKIC